MTDHEAIGICEGFITNPGKTPDEQQTVEIEAWQHLIDSGLCWELQGWFGRHANTLIKVGACQPPKDST